MADEADKSHNRFGKGSPIEEEIALQRLRSKEADFKSLVEKSHESVLKRAKRNEQVLEGIKKFGIDLRGIAGDSSKEYKKYSQRLLEKKHEVKSVKASPFPVTPFGADREKALPPSITERVPPLDYGYSTDYHSIPTAYSSSHNNAATGAADFSLGTSYQHDAAVSSAIVYLGIYFRPYTGSGTLLVSSAPAFHGNYGDTAEFTGSDTSGKIGVELDIYNASDNSFVSSVVTRDYLWDDHSYYLGIGDNNIDNPGYALGLGPIPVDISHWYLIWVYSGSRVQADQGSAYAWGNLSISVPYILWVYSPS